MLDSPPHPDLESAEKLYHYYREQEPFHPHCHLTNVIRSRLATTRRMWRRLRTHRISGEWAGYGWPALSPTMVAGFSNPMTLEIFWPRGFQRAPFFVKGWPEYLSYGAIGTLLGHEISHGFDVFGTNFDKKGMIHNWISNSSRPQFEDQLTCYRLQYSNYSIIGPNGTRLYVDGTQTLGDNMADHFGTEIAWRTWRRRSESRSSGISTARLPGVPYTNEQLFFIANARYFAEIATPDAKMRRMWGNAHSPPEIRTFGVMVNTPAFAKAFNCPRDSRMVRPEGEQCHLWL